MLKSKYMRVVTFLCLLLSSCANFRYTVDGDQVTFYLKKPDAKAVVLYCSNNGFVEGFELERQGGAWQLTLPADRPFRYFYKVDGVVFLPACPLRERDDFGSENCVFTGDM